MRKKVTQLKSDRKNNNNPDRVSCVHLTHVNRCRVICNKVFPSMSVRYDRGTSRPILCSDFHPGSSRTTAVAGTREALFNFALETNVFLLTQDPIPGTGAGNRPRNRNRKFRHALSSTKHPTAAARKQHQWRRRKFNQTRGGGGDL